MLETIEIETAPNPRFSVVWLHGLGADGGDFEPVVPELVRRAWPALRFVFPHAPKRAVTINGGMEMRAWYDITGPRLEDRQDAAGIQASIHQVSALLDRETARGVPPERQFLIGFSQGAAIALSTLVRRSQLLAGVVALSGYLPLADQALTEASAISRQIPVFIGHGSLDPMVAMALGASSRDWLTHQRYSVEWHSYLMAHAVCADEIADLGNFLQHRFAAAASAHA